MNYLGHAVLSFGDGELLTGNLIADHVKGKLALNNYPDRIAAGIILHRKIDQFTDDHPATGRAKLLFREAYGLYAGALMDSLYDHFLANDAKYFPSASSLLEFTQKTYEAAAVNASYFPPAFASYFEYMRRENWLYNYRTLQGAKRALHGLQRRAKHMADPQEAYNIFVGHYYHLAQCYYDLMDDMVHFVKVELSNG